MLANDLVFTQILELPWYLRCVCVSWTTVGGIMHSILCGWKCIQANASLENTSSVGKILGITDKAWSNDYIIANIVYCIVWDTYSIQ